MKTIFFLPTEQFARFERLATMLAESTFGVPEAYRGDVGSCLNAVDIAHRLNVSPLLVLQNVRDVGGRPSFTYQFAKALIEDSGIIAGALQYEQEGELQYDGTSADGKPYRVRAYGSTPSGDMLYGPWISWRMAELERWTDNPQYISMPEVMFRARATTFFYNQYGSSILMGFQIEGDPALGNAKAKPVPAVAATLQLPVVTTGGTNVEQVFADALKATPKADPIAIASATTSTPAAAETPTAEQGQGEQQSQPGPTTVAPSTPTEAPKPRGRKPKAAEVTGAQAPQANANPEGANTAPPQLLEQESSNPTTTAPQADSAQQSVLMDQGGEPAPAQVIDAVAPLQLEPETTGGQPLSSMERFSDAFSKVDATSPSGASLKEAMELILTFDAQEAEDLYLVLLDIAEKHLTAFVGKGKGLTAEEGEFAGVVRDLHAKTKDVALNNADLAERRKALHSAYLGLLAHLTRVKQGAAA